MSILAIGRCENFSLEDLLPMLVYNVTFIVNKVTQGINSPTIKIKLIVMLWIFCYIVVQSTFNPVDAELSECKYFWRLLE